MAFNTSKQVREETKDRVSTGSPKFGNTFSPSNEETAIASKVNADGGKMEPDLINEEDSAKVENVISLIRRIC
jgi:hypothetical protein